MKRKKKILAVIEWTARWTNPKQTEQPHLSLVLTISLEEFWRQQRSRCCTRLWYSFCHWYWKMITIPVSFNIKKMSLLLIVPITSLNQSNSFLTTLSEISKIRKHCVTTSAAPWIPELPTLLLLIWPHAEMEERGSEFHLECSLVPKYFASSSLEIYWWLHSVHSIKHVSSYGCGSNNYYL